MVGDILEHGVVVTELDQNLGDPGLNPHSALEASWVHLGQLRSWPHRITGKIKLGTGDKHSPI